MIEHSFILPKLKDTTIAYLRNGFKDCYIGLKDVKVEIYKNHTSVTLRWTDINGMLLSAFNLGEEIIFKNGDVLNFKIKNI
jgi:hypothetical protein